MTAEDLSTRQWGGVILWGPFAPVSAFDFDEIERAIGRPLPGDYREFIAVANGGSLPYAVRLPPGGEGELIEFSDLYTISGSGSGTLHGEWNAFPETYLAEHFPFPILPVARDGGGSELLLDLRDESYGSVHAFVHGLPPWAGGDNLDRGGLVAASWTAYLQMLEIDPDYAEEVWREARGPADADWLASVERWLDSGLPDWRSRPWA